MEVAQVALWVVVLLVVLALAFDFMNGFHDAANSIATVVSTGVLRPTQAVVFAGFFNIVAIFVVFGAFVQASGTGRLFSNFGAAVAGRYAGGPAKVAVITSGLFGTMSGSSVSNVVTTGSITIPLMKQLGYAPAVAGGIEAAASVGGALMPPVMGRRPS